MAVKPFIHLGWGTERQQSSLKGQQHSLCVKKGETVAHGVHRSTNKEQEKWMKCCFSERRCICSKKQNLQNRHVISGYLGHFSVLPSATPSVWTQWQVTDWKGTVSLLCTCTVTHLFYQTDFICMDTEMCIDRNMYMLLSVSAFISFCSALSVGIAGLFTSVWTKF